MQVVFKDPVKISTKTHYSIYVDGKDSGGTLIQQAGGASPIVRIGQEFEIVKDRTSAKKFIEKYLKTKYPNKYMATSKGTTIAKVKRKPGKLYFVDKDGNVKETAANRGGAKKTRKAPAKKKVAKKAAPKRKTTAKKRTATKKRK